ncbi:MAG: hypothetical protein EPN36_13755 [Rhodanobacteraceae bacterium]|nr:MAG: hypothetical protein EPN36_13755 [Rhodanobacteraceae bacterium]
MSSPIKDRVVSRLPVVFTWAVVAYLCAYVTLGSDSADNVGFIVFFVVLAVSPFVVDSVFAKFNYWFWGSVWPVPIWLIAAGFVQHLVGHLNLLVSFALAILVGAVAVWRLCRNAISTARWLAAAFGLAAVAYSGAIFYNDGNFIAVLATMAVCGVAAVLWVWWYIRHLPEPDGAQPPVNTPDGRA